MTTPASQPINLRMPPELLDRVEKVASNEQRTRSNAIIVLLTEALDAREAATKK